MNGDATALDSPREVTRRGECVWCGLPVPSRRLYCDSRCKDAARYQRCIRAGSLWVAQMARASCTSCKIPFEVTRRVILKGSKSAALCADCRRFTGQASEVPWGDCPWCGRSFVRKNGRRFCSPVCTRSRPGTATPISFCSCGECGVSFVSRGLRPRRWCSDTCARRSARRTRRHRERASGVRRHRGRVGRSAVVEQFSTREIAERDGWRCHICGKKVPDRLYKSRPLDPTLDHLVPVSVGGDHVKANVALAHNRCNYERRQFGEVQLRLVG